MHVLKKDVQRAGVKEKDDGDWVRWKEMICCGDL